MKSITITALTEKGTKALKQHYEESRKLRLIHKMHFKALGYKQTLETTTPFTLRIDINNKYYQTILEPKKLKKEIHNAMKKNGADKTDYKIEVDKDVSKM